MRAAADTQVTAHFLPSHICYPSQTAMEEGTKTKKTVFVGGINDDINEEVLYEAFSTFGALVSIT